MLAALCARGDSREEDEEEKEERKKKSCCAGGFGNEKERERTLRELMSAVRGKNI